MHYSIPLYLTTLSKAMFLESYATTTNSISTQFQFHITVLTSLHSGSGNLQSRDHPQLLPVILNHSTVMLYRYLDSYTLVQVQRSYV